MIEAAKQFYIFRHGECPFNVTGHIQGQTFNGNLTEHGRQQAANVGAALKDKEIEIIITSPLRRAVQTAQIVRSFIKDVPIWVDKRFIEVNMGEAEGMHISVAEKKFAKLYRRWRSSKPQDADACFLNGETKAEVRHRIFEALNFYATETDYQNIAVSGHGITLSQVLLYFRINRSDIPNGAILHLSFQNGHWKYEELMLS